MRFVPTPIAGVLIIEPAPHSDQRGNFLRAYCAEAFAAAGIPRPIAQANLTTNVTAGTLRGLHYQLPPAAETKVVRAVSGRIFDVAVDLRPGSPSFGHWFSTYLDAHTHCALVVPPGCAHGYQTLTPDSTVLYLVDQPYQPELERGISYADPDLGIEWPLTPTCVSVKDSGLPPLTATTLPGDVANPSDS